jgi:hypothetical protein
MTHEEIVAELTSMGSIAVEALDEAVCDAKSDEAASINNQGVEEQVAFLGDEVAEAMLLSLRDEAAVLAEPKNDDDNDVDEEEDGE